MAKVRVIISTVRYGENGFKHYGDEYNLPDTIAKEKADKGLIEIISDEEPKATKELKEKASIK